METRKDRGTPGSRRATWLVSGRTSLAAAAIAVIVPAMIDPGRAATVAQPGDPGADMATIVRDAFPADGPGAAVVVMRQGEILFAGGQGLADVAAGRAIDADTPMRLGSITKQFTAAAILKLVEDGALSLDDPLRRFFPDWLEPGGAATIRQLLNHSSGLQDFSKIPGWISANRQRAFTTAELVDFARTLPAKAAPGREWEYNNTGYILLGAIIEQVSRRPWHEVVAERLTGPLGLRTIAFPEPPPGEAASGYSRDDGAVAAVAYSHPSLPHAAGALVGSARELALWSRALHGGRVIRPELYREMIAPARLADGSTRPYGFGLRLQRLRGWTALVHGGAGAGLDAAMVHLPEPDVVAVVLANSDEPAADPDKLARRLAALAGGRPIATLHPQAVAQADAASLFGAYRVGEEEQTFRFFGRDGRYYFGQGDGQVEAFPAGDDRFIIGRDGLAWIRFVRRGDAPLALEMHRPDLILPEIATRTGDAPAAFEVPAETLRSYVGTYRTETVTLTVAMAATGGLVIGPVGSSPTPLRPTSPTEFRADEGGFRVEFHPENGRVERITLHRGARTLNGVRVAD